jgi:transposase
MPQLSDETRWLIITLSACGYIVPEISEALGCNARTTEGWLIRYAQTGSVKILPRSGRPRVTAKDDEINIVAFNKVDPFKTAVDILNESVLYVSAETIRNHLKENGLNAYRAAQKELITPFHRNMRLDFANEYLNFNHWDRAVLNDESTFVTGKPHSKIVWRAYNTRFDTENIQFVKNSGRSSVAVWGCMTVNGLDLYIEFMAILIKLNISMLWIS